MTDTRQPLNIEAIRIVQRGLAELRNPGANQRPDRPIITIDRYGNIHQGRGNADRQPVVQADKFSTEEDRPRPRGVRGIAEILGERRRNRDEFEPIEFGRPVLEVDQVGNINRDVEGERRLRDQVLADKFSHYPGLASDRRTALKEIAYVAEKVYNDWHGFEYWRSFGGVNFQFFDYFDPSSNGYKVYVVQPNINGKHEPHQCHLLKDGHICFSANGISMPDLKAAYDKSILWMMGFATFLQTGTFAWD